MEEKLIKQLLSTYREQGVDLYALVDDPLFVRLPLETKVKVIKKYADVLSRGTSRTLTKNDIRSIITDVTAAGIGGAMLGGASAMAAASHFMGNAVSGGKLPYKSIALGALISGGVFAANTAMNAVRINKHRNEIGNLLEQVSVSPTDESAIKVLIARNQQVAPNRDISVPSAAVNTIKDYAAQIPRKVISEIVPAHITHRTFVVNRNSKINPQYTAEQVNRFADIAHEAAIDPKSFMKK